MAWVTKCEFEQIYSIGLYYRFERIARNHELKKKLEDRKMKYDQHQLLELVLQDLNLYVSCGRIKGDLMKDIQAWNKRVPDEWKIDENTLTFRGKRVTIKGENQRWIVGDDFDIIFEYYKDKAISAESLKKISKRLK